MRTPSLFLSLVLLVLNTASVCAEAVRAEAYQEYWLWAGVPHRPELAHAKTIYLLQGEIAPGPSGGAYVKYQGGAQPGPHGPALWLVYRVRTLDWSPGILSSINRRLELWRPHAGELKGVQLDFDASTAHLADYARFLREVRASLPPDCKLSVTGLMDWASQARPEDLDQLSGAVDELIFQTYRGRKTVNDIEAYLKRVDRLHIAFKLGLAEGAEWVSPNNVQKNPYFKGYVIFLQNQKHQYH